MKPLHKGLLLALLHLLIVGSLGAKLLYDRASRPRLWMKVASYDPDLFIRGRYLSLNLDLPYERMYDRRIKKLAIAVTWSLKITNWWLNSIPMANIGFLSAVHKVIR